MTEGKTDVAAAGRRLGGESKERGAGPGSGSARAMVRRGEGEEEEGLLTV